MAAEETTSTGIIGSSFTESQKFFYQPYTKHIRRSLIAIRHLQKDPFEP